MPAPMLRRRAFAGLACVGGGTLAHFTSMEQSDTHTLESAVKQYLIYEILKVAGWQARRRHDQQCEVFAETQKSLLVEQLTKNASTAYGSSLGFKEMLQADDVVSAFRASQPITEYRHWAPWVDRIANGEANVLLDEPESMLAATSGTSGQRALLPYNQSMATAFFKFGILVVFDTLRRTLPESFELQKTCKLAFAPSWTQSASGLRIGPNSSNPADKSFRRLLLLYSTPSAGYEISNDERAALYVHALFAVKDSRLGILEANFVHLPYRLLQLLQEHGDSIANDVAEGKIDRLVASRIEPSKVAELEEALGGGDPRRAEQVREALRAASNPSDDVGLARRLWPKLRLILANATGAFETYADKLLDGDARDVPILSTVYAASEGLMGVSK